MAGELTTTGLRRGLGIVDLDTGGGVLPEPPAGFALLRTQPGTAMRNLPDAFVIAPQISAEGVGA